MSRNKAHCFKRFEDYRILDPKRSTNSFEIGDAVQICSGFFSGKQGRIVGGGKGRDLRFRVLLDSSSQTFTTFCDERILQRVTQ